MKLEHETEEQQREDEQQEREEEELINEFVCEEEYIEENGLNIEEWQRTEIYRCRLSVLCRILRRESREPGYLDRHFNYPASIKLMIIPDGKVLIRVARG